MAFAVTYAGIPFQLDDPKIAKWIAERIPVDDLCDINPVPDRPGRNLSALGFPLWPKRPKLRIGEFFYPTGASRWSEFHALATTSTVRQMMQATFTHAGTGPVPSTFILQADPSGTSNLVADSPGGVTTPMLMLPPRPLSPYGVKSLGQQFDDLYLVSLVDERYFNASAPVSLGPDGVITWTSIFNTIASGLGITLTIPSVSGYGVPHPDSAFWSDAENGGYQLDAAAWNVGCTVVRNYDSTYQLIPFSTINYPSLLRPWAVAGGQLDSILTDSQGLVPFLESVLPTNVYVSFPKYLANYGYYANLGSFTNAQPVRYIPWINDTYPDIFAVSVPITNATGKDQLGNNISSYGGNGKTLFLHDTARAYYTNWGDANPANVTNLTNLATQLANDFWNFMAIGIDQVYPGIRNWTPEGNHDLLFSWCYKKCTTRVMRKPWNFRMIEFAHDLADGSDGPNAGPANELIRAATSTPDGSGRYDAFVRRWNGTIYSDTEEVWLRAANSETINSGTQYIAHLMNFENGRKVYTTSIQGSGGGGGGVVVRVNAAGAANTLTAAFVETWTDGTPPTAADGAACWALDINGLAIQAGKYDAVTLLTHSDSKVVYGVDSGLSGTFTLCESDGTSHNYTFARGRLTTRV